MECAQLRITGGGNATPSPIAHFPGAYSGTFTSRTQRNAYLSCAGTDPGILIGIYYPPVTNYTIPGMHAIRTDRNELNSWIH